MIQKTSPQTKNMPTFQVDQYIARQTLSTISWLRLYWLDLHLLQSYLQSHQDNHECLSAAKHIFGHYANIFMLTPNSNTYDVVASLTGVTSRLSSEENTEMTTERGAVMSTPCSQGRYLTSTRDPCRSVPGSLLPSDGRRAGRAWAGRATSWRTKVVWGQHMSLSPPTTCSPGNSYTLTSTVLVTVTHLHQQSW